MDINGSSRYRHRKTPSTDRFLTAFPRTSQPPSSAEEDELNEDDIFSTGDFSLSSNHRNSPPSTTASPRYHHLKTPFLQSESFGILAALPDSHKLNTHNHLYQKTAVSSPPSSSSSSTTSSSRFIPTIPKPPQDRIPSLAGGGGLGKSLNNQPMSAPVNVPVMAMAMRGRRRHKEFDEIDEDDDDDVAGDGEMLPPHEIVARAHTPIVACSVLEGVGRTLKGRDLRQGNPSNYPCEEPFCAQGFDACMCQINSTTDLQFQC